MIKFPRAALTMVATFAIVPPALGTGILNSSHNLSISGPGQIKAATEERVCIFCHTPHHANPSTPLWSRPTSTTVYDLYESTTLIAKPGQPSGSARLCLSCHDGTIALGALYSTDPNRNTIEMAGGIVKLPAERASNLGGSSGKNLTNDHPISFAYTDDLARLNGQLALPGALPANVRLEEGGGLQCTACHNPHSNPYGKFLVMDNSASGLCVVCHTVSGYGASLHSTAHGMSARCNLCHVSHNAGGSMRLMIRAAEEDNCYSCHSGSGTAKDVKSAATKFYNHPMAATTGIHDPKEDPLSAQKHVECQDCHNPHKVLTAPAAPPVASGALYGVRGVSSAGEVMPGDAVNQYEVCYRCHAENNFFGTQNVLRQIHELNTRLDFDPQNPSFHPVVSIGKGGSVPSLRAQYSTSSMIYCTDCHSNNDSSQAKGPHGSSFMHILAARYETDTYPLDYSESNYALCFRCHDQLVLLDPARSPFPQHQWHVVAKKVPCSVCHDPHGVPQIRGGNSSANSHLINFDLRFVTSGAVYDSVAKSCSVSCHASNPHLYQ